MAYFLLLGTIQKVTAENFEKIKCLGPTQLLKSKFLDVLRI